jgi:8-oxo-dGTP pyrophosphatase MutT (NUDIX family)
MEHKAIAIPFIQDPGGPRFLLVHDKRYKEWTFVTGGCHHREVINPIRTAIRELEEETRGVIALRKGTYKYFKFAAPSAWYHVFIFKVSLDTSITVDRFNHEKWRMDTKQVCFRKNYDENDSMVFLRIDQIRECGRLWQFIQENVIDNPDFYNVLASETEHKFSLETSDDRKQAKTATEAT